MSPVYTPVRLQGSNTKQQIGSYAMLTEKEANEALEAAATAWNHGRGEWPQASVATRIAAVEKFLEGFKAMKDKLAEILMWEICKTQKDAEGEVQRTIEYIQATISALKSLVNEGSTFTENGGVVAQIRRSPLGVVLCAGPFNCG